MMIFQTQAMYVYNFLLFFFFFLGPKSETGFYDGNLAEDILSPLFFWFCEGISPI